MFTTNVGETIKNKFNVNGKLADVIYSEELMEKKVVRIRPIIEAEGDQAIVMVLRGISEFILNEITLSGFPEISKVSYTKSADEIKGLKFDKETGGVI